MYSITTDSKRKCILNLININEHANVTKQKHTQVHLDYSHQHECIK